MVYAPVATALQAVNLWEVARQARALRHGMLEGAHPGHYFLEVVLVDHVCHRPVLQHPGASRLLDHDKGASAYGDSKEHNC
eukprot:10547390-Alexandrium_andersonii.AAC.1